jgi:hypothetical protein
MTTRSGIAGIVRKDVDEHVDDLVHHAAAVGSGDAEDRRECRCQCCGTHAEEKRTACSDDDLREDVAPLVRRPEEVIPGRGLTSVQEAEAVRIADRDERRDERDEGNGADHEQADPRLRVSRAGA